MKKWQWVTAACVLILAGCQTYEGIAPPEQRFRPQVTVTKDGRIEVSPEILFYFRNERDVSIVWQLPRGGQYKFPNDGIVIEGELVDQVLRTPGSAASVALNRNQREIVDCKAKSDVEFVCLNRHTRPGIYKYTIRVDDGKNPALQRDPPMVNM